MTKIVAPTTATNPRAFVIASPRVGRTVFADGLHGGNISPERTAQWPHPGNWPTPEGGRTMVASRLLKGRWRSLVSTLS